MEKVNHETKSAFAASNLHSYLDEAFNGLFGGEIRSDDKRAEDMHATAIVSPEKTFLLSGAELEHPDDVACNKNTAASWRLCSLPYWPLGCALARIGL